MDAQMKRTIAFVGHAHCGKTTLVESALFVSGAISRKGDVMKGTTTSDFNDDERERQISINASFLQAGYNGHQIQMIDAPGYADFFGEMISSLRAVDAAVIVVDATNGVEVGTEEAWQRCENLKLPCIFFINKIEKEGASLDDAHRDIKEQLSSKAVKIDLNSSELIEAVAETDDQLLEKYLESGELAPDVVSGALRKAVISRKIFPVIAGVALEDKGTKELLDAILAYLPSPVERPLFEVGVPGSDEKKMVTLDENGPFLGLIFKTMIDPHLGALAMMRVFRGVIAGNINVFNSTQSAKEHIGTINMLQGKEQMPITKAGCGDIVALPKLRNAHVSDTFCDEKEKLIINPLVFPEPSISASIKPKTRADEEKITASLYRLCEEDQTFKMSRNAETKEMLISGMGDLHLKIMMDRMKNRYHVEVELGRPKVTYRETINKSGKFRYKYKKQSGGRGQYGDVELEVHPLPRDSEQYVFESKIFGGAIPRNYIPSVEKGVKQTVAEGVLAGYPIYNIQVLCTDGSYHDVDSSDLAFQIAGAMALKEALKQAGMVLLEPIMEVSIAVQGDFMGQISGDLSSRRGKILGTESRGKKEVIKAHIPLSEMFTYATDLRSLTGGRGSYSMKFSHYELAPQKIAEKVIAEAQEAKAAAAAH